MFSAVAFEGWFTQSAPSPIHSLSHDVDLYVEWYLSSQAKPSRISKIVRRPNASCTSQGVKEIAVNKGQCIEETAGHVRMRDQAAILTLIGRERLSWCNRLTKDQTPGAPTGGNRPVGPCQGGTTPGITVKSRKEPRQCFCETFLGVPC